jgi:preprotein translocase subunit SecG
VFFLTSLGLTYVSSHKGRPEGVMSTHQESPVEPAKSVPVPGTAAPQPSGGDSKASEIPK